MRTDRLSQVFWAPTAADAIARAKANLPGFRVRTVASCRGGQTRLTDPAGPVETRWTVVLVVEPKP